MITERRQHPRKTPLEFTFIQLEQEFAGHVLNFSKEGLSFETSAPICDSDLVQFWISFRKQGQIDGVGRITWLNEERNRGGIAFVHLSRSSRQKVDEWTAVFPEGTVASVGAKPVEEESPAEIVSKIMGQVLTEKRHHVPVVAAPSVRPADAGNATGAATAPAREPERVETSNSPDSAVLTVPDVTEPVAMSELQVAESPETQAREPERVEASNSPASAVLTAPDVTEPVAMTELQVAESPEAQAQEPERMETSDSLTPALLPPADTTEGADVTEQRTDELPETSAHGEAVTITATTDDSADSSNTDAAPVVEVYELDPTEPADLFAPPDVTPATTETDDLWNAAGPIAPEEKWHVEPVPAIDEPTKSLFEETPTPSATTSFAPEAADAAPTNNAAATDLESALPAPAVRKWPSATPLVSTTPTEQNQGSRHEGSSQEETRELVPLKQYLYTQHLQFLRGAGIGILLSLVIGISAYKLWKPAQQGVPSEDTRKVAAANSTIASEATMREPASPALNPESKGSESSEQKGQDVVSPRKAPAGRADLAAPGQAPRTSAMASSDNAAVASTQNASNTPTNAIPRPSSFANRNSTAESGVQPLFNLSQPTNADGSTAGVAPENGPPAVGVDLGSTPWSFHRRNIHGTIPVGGEVRPAELISSAAPHYPQAAKARQIYGDVVIDAIIDTHGNVRKPQVVSGPTLLRTAAVNAVLGWKYKPALLDGKPTEVHETITVKFLPQ